ncbi:protein FAR1-RELATED SEQUENCE 5-like [Carya illinoinensis]|uniref:protein FAR1-RELATED SEQUENCE 5-like n=1 Tax=Carya illinoinensis TaxID=32201 RepID=UPI001C71E377|nr:protein FAR1-RELATED SEQUENCE 5-like [Carya illinoinensis]
MEKGEEHSSRLIPSSPNRPTTGIPSTSLSFRNYMHMHGFYGEFPTWSPALMQHPDGYQYPCGIQEGNDGYPTPVMTTGSAASERGDVAETPNCRETEFPSTSARVEEPNCDRPDSMETEDEIGETSQLDNEIGGDTILEPKSKMEFNSFEEVMTYYKQYAKSIGFGVMTRRTEKGDDGTVRYATLDCARGGKARNRTLNVARPRPTGKTECKTKINVLKVDGKFQLTTVNNIHNHGLSPKKARFFRCNREVSDSVKRVLDTNDLAGIRMNKSFGSLVVGAGGFENLPFLEKDCRNYIDKARHLRLGAGGAGALQEYFLRMQYKNHGFFASMDLDDDGRLKNVFWADPRSRAAYEDFGDVVTFDTTYLTNRYGMPFAPFVGVNHHGQSILLGAGLISSEDTATFVWLFKTWLQCMDGIAPRAIITDQDRAMKNAIAIVFPKSRHRFCLWHILKKVPEKLSSYSAYKSGMKSALMKSVYDSQNVEEFESSWAELITTYNLEENAWLQTLYTERAHWVPAFLKDTFWAGMSTTQRSESMNAFFDCYVHAKTNLKEFVDQFDNALKKKIENENTSDFHSFSVTIPCISRSPIEKKFQECYTNAKFREVQRELQCLIDLSPELLKRDGGVKTYLVEDEVHVEEFTKTVRYSVDFSDVDTTMKCSCGLFQMRSILCRHILAVFKCNGLKVLPNQYILDRWRKDIRRRYTLIDCSYDAGGQRADANRYSTLLNICYKMITHAAGSKKHTEDALQKLHAMITLYSENQEAPSRTCTGSNVIPSIPETETCVGSQKVLSPLVVRGKGRPPSLRRASVMEKEMRKVKSKANNATVKKKRKQRAGGDTPMLDTCRNLFGPSEADISNVGLMESHPLEDSPVVDISGTQRQESIIASQESMHFGMDGSQPVAVDESQPRIGVRFQCSISSIDVGQLAETGSKQ